MAIIGLGMDIVEIGRIGEIVARSGDRLAKRILTQGEWTHYQRHSQPIHFLAKRFAAKEAAAKALGCGIRNGVAFNQFELTNDAVGKPQLRLYGRAAEIAAAQGVGALHITLADERRYACATVILEG